MTLLKLVIVVDWHVQSFGACHFQDVFDHLDGMMTFYNWVVHEQTVRTWFLNNGFADYWKAILHGQRCVTVYLT